MNIFALPPRDVGMYFFIQISRDLLVIQRRKGRQGAIREFAQALPATKCRAGLGFQVQAHVLAKDTMMPLP